MIGNLTVGFTNARSLTLLRTMLYDAEKRFETDESHVELVDFSSLKFSDVRTILLFRAWVESTCENHPKAKFKGLNFVNDSWAPYYISVGLFDFFDEQTRKSLKNLLTRIYPHLFFRCKSGFGNEETAEPMAAYEVGKLYSQYNDDEIKMNLIGACVNEALHNCLNWGYASSDTVRVNEKWWVAARVDETRKEFNFMVYDHGFGAPARFKNERLQKLGVISNLLKLSEDSSDTEVLYGMMQMDDEGIRQLIPDGRCRGLAQMRKLAREFPRGHFSIRSGFGEYDCTALNGTFRSETNVVSKHQPRFQASAGFVPGTLLSWTLSEKET